MFHQAVHRRRYDAIVCMYHDQGHGPMKLLAFDTGVNVTLGLPIIRTSVDHGTAFDIAWQGVAFTDSLQPRPRLRAGSSAAMSDDGPVPPGARPARRAGARRRRRARPTARSPSAASRCEPGSEVAITIGSRGITDLTTVVGRIVAWVRAQGATPFLVPAMGSHGGATAEGQREVLAAYGFADGWEGCAVRSSMDVVPVAGDHDLPVPIVTDAHAAAAAATIVVNRVKQHTDFHGPYESGLMKMTAIGLGKRVQAEALHAHGTRGLRELMPRVAEHVLANGNIVLGVAIVENALDQTMVVQAVPAADDPDRRAGPARRRPGPRRPPARRRPRRAADRPDGQGHQRRRHRHQRHRPHDDRRRARPADAAHRDDRRATR